MSQRFAEHLADVIKWRDFHASDAMSIEQHVKFQAKTIDNLLELMADVLEDVTDLEGRPKESLGRRIWTTRGMRLTGDLTRFG